MRIPGRGTVQHLAGTFRHRFSSGVLILLYHRIRPAPCFDPYVLGVTPEHFAEHLEVLQRLGLPMHLRQVLRGLRDGNLPRRAIVVTFDDGYADNLHHAKPLLERYGIPATVFVTTGYTGQAAEFWWDDLERLVLQPGELPEILELEINGSSYRWELGKAASYREIDYKLNQDWDYGKDTEPSPRHRLFRSLYRTLNTLPDTYRRKVLAAIREWAKIDPVARPTHRALTTDEVVTLARGGLIEVGAHTVTHPVLGSLPAAVQQDEIEGSKARLEEILGTTVASFAYPYGSRARSDYTEETVAIVRGAGFACACSNLAKAVRQDADPFQLSRAGVRDWDGDHLAGRLRAWFRS
jgi:peptidoglycan/xylan/chitin deacetylase (PgdA/CDA1 family)